MLLANYYPLEEEIYQVLNFMYYIVILTWELIQILGPINWDDVIKKEARGINNADLRQGSWT